MWQVVF
ncbi:hypothetical protein VCHC56A1_3613, partial [Vibrio cholerae HC-56A1]